MMLKFDIGLRLGLQSSTLLSLVTADCITFRLLNHKGSLLAYAGSEDKDAKVTAAVASNIWSAYEKSGKLAFHNEGLKFMFLNCEVSCFPFLEMLSDRQLLQML